ncbi:MAG TPA: thioredoxin domain-containing protein [Myxococcaceae bacterium]|nr:thioredoxin domain-containing protein [Myxococcaceae bacterium]
MHPELEIRSDDHVQGSALARLTLLEYGDYQCPYCARAFVAIHEAQRALGPDLRLVFRNFPLTEVHPYALPAAQAAEAADRQGRFWPMHDALYTHQSELSPELFGLLAEEFGFDLERFEKDGTSEEVIGRIRRDLRSAEQLQLPGTPSLFVNGVPYRGRFGPGELTPVLERLLQASEEISP